MRPNRRSILWLPLGLFLSAGPGHTAAADETRCVLGNVKRFVEVVPVAEEAVPCGVHYRRSSDADTQVLWNAQNDRSYCVSRAAQLVSKLESAGWQCTGSSSMAGDNAAPAPPEVGAPPPPAPIATIGVALAPPPPSGDTAPATGPDDGEHAPSTPVSPAVDPAPSDVAEREVAAIIEPAPSAVLGPEDTLRPSRNQLVHDPKLRFYRETVGIEILHDSLRIVRVDLNGDGRDELFLRVEQSDACGNASSSCPWDLFQVGDDGALESLGIHGIRGWRSVANDASEYPDLVVESESTHHPYRLFRYALGLYREQANGVDVERLWETGLEIGMGGGWRRVDTLEP